MPVWSGHDKEIPTTKAVLASATAPEVVWRFHDDTGIERTLKPLAALRLSSLLMVRDAVLGGAGIALLPKLLVENDVKAGRLAQWGVDARPPVEIWALRNSRRLVGAKVRAFLDVIEQAFPERNFVPQA
jgi:DNA-binding transcriptional LysR family regulator